MCADYTPSRPDRIAEHFGAPQGELFDESFDDLSRLPAEAFPGSQAPILRAVRVIEHGRATMRIECVPACFGMVPHWADAKLARSTYNARTETVASKPSFREAWRRGQFCIIPAEHIFEPRYDGGQAVRWRIELESGAPMGIAGIWETKPGAHGGPPLLSFSMLTINADEHELMRHFHRPGDEKRMVVLLEPSQYGPWLRGELAMTPDVYRPFPAELLTAHPAPMPPRAKPVPRTIKHNPEPKPARAPRASGPASDNPDQGSLF